LLQKQLQKQIAGTGGMEDALTGWPKLTEHFRLLQATDNLSLLSCVDFRGEATLLHPLATVRGEAAEVKVTRVGERSFRLAPYPLDRTELVFHVPARFVSGVEFGSSEELQAAFAAAELQQLEVRISA
jgi:hypothetical protein